MICDQTHAKFIFYHKGNKKTGRIKNKNKHICKSYKDYEVFQILGFWIASFLSPTEKKQIDLNITYQREIALHCNQIFFNSVFPQQS